MIPRIMQWEEGIRSYTEHDVLCICDQRSAAVKVRVWVSAPLRFRASEHHRADGPDPRAAGGLSIFGARFSEPVLVDIASGFQPPESTSPTID